MEQKTQSRSIDLAPFGGPVFTGRRNGIAARGRLRLNDLDATDAVVTVRLPPDTYALNSSFFLGLFGKSVRAAGSREVFRSRFRFEVPSHLETAIDVGIERALQDRNPLING